MKFYKLQFYEFVLTVCSVSSIYSLGLHRLTPHSPVLLLAGPPFEFGEPSFRVSGSSGVVKYQLQSRESLILGPLDLVVFWAIKALYS